MAGKRKIINDPVFGFISLPNEFLFDVLQHPFVQRLNRIRQLGLSYFVYPGAIHSRFLHSLGAMHLMSEAIATLRLKGIEISRDEANAAEAAILLHDIGHGPFSHVLEHTLVSGIDHEDISLLMMEQINKDLDGRLDLAIQIFKDEYPRHFLHQLISSQLDVDRLDYLCRDSFFCGVTEGSVASARILKMLSVVEDKLVVESKGIYSIEKFLVARRLMYWQVYLHKTSVAAEQLLIRILTRAKQLVANGKELFCSPALHYFLYKEVTWDNFSLDDYARLDDSDVLSAIKAWIDNEDFVLSTLCYAFTNRRLFKMQIREGELTEEEKNNLTEQYAVRFNISNDDAQYFFGEHVISKKTYSAKDDAIDILFNDGNIVDIASASDMLNLNTLTKEVKKYYLFYYK